MTQPNMEEKQNGKNPLTHKRNFRYIFNALSLTTLKLKTYEYCLYQFLVDEWIYQFQPHDINLSVLRPTILRTIINHDSTFKSAMDKLVRLGLLEYDPWAGLHKNASVVIKNLAEDGFNVDDFCEALLKTVKNAELVLPVPKECEETEIPVAAIETVVEKTEEEVLLVSHLIGKLRAKAEELGVEVGRNKSYDLFQKGENKEAAYKILEMLRVKRLGEAVTTEYIEAEVNRIGIVAKQKQLLMSFNPFGIALKSNVFGLTERKKKGNQVPKQQKPKTQIPSKKEFIPSKHPL